MFEIPGLPREMYTQAVRETKGETFDVDNMRETKREEMKFKREGGTGSSKR